LPRKIGFVFQSFHLIPRLTAAENIELPLTLGGVPIDERKMRVQNALQALNSNNAPITGGACTTPTCCDRASNHYAAKYHIGR
jgi:alpha-D-ribose 1-methylphosphonate 5-triphosphate synthase subunit PhnL